MPGAEAARKQYLSFTVAGTDYGVPLLKVREILQYVDATRVPSLPEWIRGVLNVRGAVIPVVDLARKFGKESCETTRLTCVLTVETQLGGEVLTTGVLADAVREVVDLAEDEVDPPPSFGAGVKLDFVIGIGKVGKGLLILLDIDRVLAASEAELVAVRELAADHAAVAEAGA